MSEVWIGLNDAQRGSIPARCAKSGQRCITRYAHQVSTLPRSLEWLTWTELWPLQRDEPKVDIVLPLLPSWQRVDVGLRRARDVSAVVMPVLVLVILASPGTVSRVAGWAALIAFATHLLFAVLGYLLTVNARIDQTGAWVRLSGIHSDLAIAIERMTERPAAEPMLVAPDEPAGLPLHPPARDPAGGS